MKQELLFTFMGNVRECFGGAASRDAWAQCEGTEHSIDGVGAPVPLCLTLDPFYAHIEGMTLSIVGIRRMHAL